MKLTRKSLLLLATICLLREFVATASDENPFEECDYWDELCSKLDDSGSINYKKCIAQQTIYYYSPVKAKWAMARFYCQSIFNGYKNADLLYIKDSTEFDRFVEFASHLNLDDVVSTSALCCVQNVGQPKNCVWPFNSKSIEHKFIPPNLRGSGTDCSFLTMSLNKESLSLKSPKEPWPFKGSLSVSSEEANPFVCSYTRPPENKCRPKTKPPTKATAPPTTPTTRHSNSGKTPTRTTTTTTTTTLKPDHPDTHSTPPPGEKQCSAKNGTYGIEYWPPVLHGKTSIAQCPNNADGSASWHCGQDGKFIDPPDINCTHKWIDPWMKEMQRVKDIDTLNNLTRQLSEDIGEPKRNKEVKFPKDLTKMVEVLKEIQQRTDHFAGNLAKERHNTVKEITHSVAKTCSKILSYDDPWKNGRKNETVRNAENVLRYIQYAGVTLGCTEANLEKVPKNKENVSTPNIFISAFNMDHQQPINFSYNGLDFLLTNQIDDDGIPVSRSKCNHNIGVGAVFEKLSQYLSINMTDDNLVINSEIVAFNYNNKSTMFPLKNSTYARILLTHNSPLEFGSKPNCVFWDFSKNAWSSEGCWIEPSLSSKDESLCVCNHLTSFSVLMDVSGRETPSQVKNILTILCTVSSVVCLLFTIGLFLLCRELQSRRTTILINLSISLIIVDLLVLFGLDQTNHPVICKSVSVLLLYWLLASFSWMLMEGYQLYQMVILVFNNIGHLRMVYLFIIGYGVPLLIAAVSAVPIHLNGGLTNEYFCWITSTKHPYQVLALVVPGTLVIITNTIIMFLVLRTVAKMKFGKNGKTLRPATSSSPSKITSTAVSSSPNGGAYTTTKRHIQQATNGNSNSTKRLFAKGTSSSVSISEAGGTANNSSSDVPLEKQISQWMSYIKGYVSLIVLMGITWITYVLYIHEYGHFFSYVFIVLNGLQGVFIFITQFVFDSKTYGAVKKRFYQFMGQDYFRSMTNSSSTKNTVSSSYSTSTRANTSNANNSVAVSETDYQNTLNRSDKDLSSQSSSGASSLNQNSELAGMFREHPKQQRKLSLEYF